MVSAFYRTLTAAFVLFCAVSLANAQSGATQQSTVSPGSGWTFVQDTPLIFCGGVPPPNPNGCNITIGNMVPTVAGSVWIIVVGNKANNTIASVTGGGGTWVRCPNCHIFNGTTNTDAWYNLTGNAGTDQNITVAMSATLGSTDYFSGSFVEILPPPGTVASYDDSASGAPGTCTTCTAPSLANITATDGIVRNDGGAPTSWNAWSAPYITDANGFAIGLNVNSGTGPTVTYTSARTPAYMALAFKSSAGTFTPPSPQYSVVNYTAPSGVNGGSGQNCSPSCSVTIPATGGGHLLYLESGALNGTRIIAVNGGGTWVIPPTGSSGCFGQATLMGQNMAQSCAYVLSSTAGATSVNITMSGSGSIGFAIYEIASNTGGTFTLDAIGNHVSTSSGVWYPSGQALSLTGTNDVIIQALICVGGSSGPNYYAEPYNIHSYNYFLFNEAATAILTNSGPNPPTPVWVNPQANNMQPGTIASGVAFTAVGGSSSAPNPPTGLTVVVQ